MQIVAVVALGLVVLLGILGAPRDWARSQPILSTYNIVLIGFALYALFPAVLVLMSDRYTWAPQYYSDEHFSATVWLCVLAVVAFIYSNRLSRGRGPGVEPTADRRYEADARPGSVLLVALLTIGLALKVYLVVSSGGLDQSVIRLSDYASNQASVQQLDAEAIGVRTISGIADGAATWGVIRALRDRQNLVAWTLIFVVTLGLSYLTIGKRLLLILPLICVAMGVHVYRRRLTIRLVPFLFLGVVGIGFVTLLARIFLPIAAVGGTVDLANIQYADGSVLAFYFYSLEFSTIEMMSVAVQSGSAIADLFGGPAPAFASTNLLPILYSVPRGLWPAKPETFYDLSYGVSAALGATPFQDPTVGYASTLVGTSFIIMGVLGVIGAFVLFGIISGFVDRRLTAGRWSIGSVILFSLALVAAFHMFRQGTIGWTFIVSFVQQYGAIAAFVMLALQERRAATQPQQRRPRRRVIVH